LRRSGERDCDAAHTEAGIPITGRSDDVRQHWARIRGCQRIVSQTKNPFVLEHLPTRQVGKYDAAIPVDDTGSETVQCFHEGRRFRRLGIQHISNQRRPANMPRNQAAAPARLVVDDAVVLVTKHAEQRRAGCRLSERRRQEIHQAPWVGPLLMKT
jgi:hypothetical protein